MIRRKSGLKEVTWLMLASAALISVACGDDDDDLYGDTGGSSGSSTAGKSSGGSSTAGKGSGGSNAGSTAGGTTAGGSTTGGTAGTTNEGGEPNGGTMSEGGTDGEGGDAAGGVPSEGGAGGEGGVPVVVDTLDNPSFEQGPNPGAGPTDGDAPRGWVNEATPAAASYVKWGDTKDAAVRLAHWNAAAYTARVSQKVGPIENGTYSFSIWVKRDTGKTGEAFNLTQSYLFAKGFDAADTAKEVKQDTTAVGNADYAQVKISGIVVTNHEITVGVYTDALAGGWINFDLAELTPE